MGVTIIVRNEIYFCAYNIYIIYIYNVILLFIIFLQHIIIGRYKYASRSYSAAPDPAAFVIREIRYKKCFLIWSPPSMFYQFKAPPRGVGGKRGCWVAAQWAWGDAYIVDHHFTAPPHPIIRVIPTD